MEIKLGTNTGCKEMNWLINILRKVIDSFDLFLSLVKNTFDQYVLNFDE